MATLKGICYSRRTAARDLSPQPKSAAYSGAAPSECDSTRHPRKHCKHFPFLLLSEKEKGICLI
jgi:hypothetical protein